MKYTYLSLAVVTVLATLFFVTTASAVTCGTATANATKPLAAGYGLANDVVLGTKKLWMRAGCGTATVTMGLGDKTRLDNTLYVYNTSYRHNGTAWVPVTGGTGAANVFTKGGYDVTLAANQTQPGLNHFVAWICALKEGQWKCGCEDIACTKTPRWSLQTFTNPNSAPAAPTLSAQCKTAVDFLEELIRLRYTVNPNYVGFSNDGLNLQSQTDARFARLLVIGFDTTVPRWGGEYVSAYPAIKADKTKMETYVKDRLKKNQSAACTMVNELIDNCAQASVRIRSFAEGADEDRLLYGVHRWFMAFTQAGADECKEITTDNELELIQRLEDVPASANTSGSTGKESLVE